MAAEDVAELKAHIDGRLARVVSFVTTGRENSWMNPGLEEWAWLRDPATVTLNEVLAAVGDVDEEAIATRVLAVLSPEAIAAALDLPAELGDAVVDALHRRTAPPAES